MKNKKRLLIISMLLIFTTGSIILLKYRVTTRQGINFKVYTFKIPLYLKLLDFMDRHCNYKQLVNRIITRDSDPETKVMEILVWTHQNIKRKPNNLAVIDDHVWHIIIRGYGVIDQFQDVFTTLCNYAGLDAFFAPIYDKERGSLIPLSFVNLDNRLYVFDPYNGVYFKNKDGQMATIGEIKDNNWTVAYIPGAQKLSFDYKAYLTNLSTIEEIGLTKANIQSPFKRLIFEVRKWIRIN